MNLRGICLSFSLLLLIACGDDDATSDASTDQAVVLDQEAGDAPAAIDPECAKLNCAACSVPANSQACGSTQSANVGTACKTFLDAQTAGECGKS